MLTSFLDGIGEKLAERSFIATLAPGLLFWTVGLVVVAGRSGGMRRIEGVARWLDGASALTQAALLAAAVSLVMASSVVVRRTTWSVTAFLEGYWPRWLAPVRQRLIDRQSVRIDRASRRFVELAARIDDGRASAEERREFIELDNRLRRIPAEPESGVIQRRMPTRFGNILRAAESRPVDKYGLDAVRCWPSFWLVLPDATRQELTEARSALDAAVTSWTWAVLLWVWVPFNAWVLPLAAVAAPAIYHGWILSRAGFFADVLEAAFDVHRSALYRALRWPLPANPAEERTAGRSLTQYLWRGSDDPSQRFVSRGE